VEGLLGSIRIRWNFLSSSSVKCGSFAGILRIPTEGQLSSLSGVSGYRLVRNPKTLPWSGRFANHSKSFIRFSYIICASTNRIVEFMFVLLYIRSRV
jgi:hypothetical protein